MNDIQVKRRLDYQAPAYFIEFVDLSIELDPDKTTVTNLLSCHKNPECEEDLVLDGEGLTLVELSLDGEILKDYIETPTSLTISSKLLNDSFELRIKNTISPKQNTSLEGLYYADGAFCTQCEAEGFRKITYFVDRPDVLSSYTCHLICDNPELKYLLSNGNKVGDEVLDDGRRKVSWHDPHKKPCYLFALVAGDFDFIEDTYTTISGKAVSLQLFVEKGRKHQGYHAIESLKKSMAWDEQNYGLEYDLDIYMIVAVDSFNMGAMENKGLNVFNSKYVLAAPETATDQDYFNIEAIIAHEYFHNWTGNRVTCRDWFQLSLKEGLTVFRDQSFSADMFNPLSTRIDQVKIMKEHQFSEDSGPMSHPIRPDEVMEMNNFYTVTVYDKGAEVIRMMHTLLGKDMFRKGMDLYFKRHDGHAVTCDDFVSAMQDASGIDLTHFSRWYAQSGTPLVKVGLDEGSHQLRFEQINLPTADQKDKHDLFIPINIECLNTQGDILALNDDLFVLNKASKTMDLPPSTSKVIPVLLSDFSAPVKIEYEYSADELFTILQYASSDYSKWDASQQIYIRLVNSLYTNSEAKLNAALIDKLLAVIPRLSSKQGVLAEILSLPSTETLLLTQTKVNPLNMSDARAQTLQAISEHGFERLLALYHEQKCEAYQYKKSQVNKRKLKNTCLNLLAHAREDKQHCEIEVVIESQFFDCDNMTDKLGAIKAAQSHSVALFDKLMQSFESQYSDDAVVMDKWFAMHANTERNDILAHLDLLASHQQYSMTNPNKVRSLIGSFAFYNTKGFHAADGSGYRFLCDYLMELDAINPQVSSRLVSCLIKFKDFDESRQSLMKEQLSRLLNHPKLSKDLFEKVSKSLLND